MTTVFPESTFDLVVAHNALDHSHDPVEALRAAVHVVKPSCWVALWHIENEGKLASYSDLHQWNFSQEDGRFVIWNRSVYHDDMLHELLQADHIVVEAQNHHDTDWLHVRIRKSS